MEKERENLKREGREKERKRQNGEVEKASEKGK